MRSLCSLNFACKSDSAIFHDTDFHVLLKKKKTNESPILSSQTCILKKKCTSFPFAF